MRRAFSPPVCRVSKAGVRPWNHVALGAPPSRAACHNRRPPHYSRIGRVAFGNTKSRSRTAALPGLPGYGHMIPGSHPCRVFKIYCSPCLTWAFAQLGAPAVNHAYDAVLFSVRPLPRYQLHYGGGFKFQVERASAPRPQSLSRKTLPALGGNSVFPKK